MTLFPHTLILRHRKENLKKCSLRGLETRPDCSFFTYPQDLLLDLTGYILLKPGAPLLTQKDASQGLFLIDATWRYAQLMFEQLPQPHQFEMRSLPSQIVTAYPRRQEENCGLASAEALYVAFLITGRDPTGLLDHYYWKSPFLEKNREALTFSSV